MNSVFSTDISHPEINIGKNSKSFNFLMFIIFIIVVVIIIVVVPWDKLEKKREEMSGGVISQMFAQDSQDVYLKGNVDKIATGNYNLFWNQPTREANVFSNRGDPLYSILLPDTPMNPSPTMLEVSNNYVNNIIDNQVDRKIDKLTFTNPVLTTDNILPKQAQTQTYSKSNPNSNKTKDYETINEKVSKHNDYLAYTETNKQKKNKKVNILDKNSLPSNLPIDIVTNSNPYELASVGKIVATTKETSDNLPMMVDWTPENKLFQMYTDKAINNRDCIRDPASCALGSAGGSRLNDSFVQSTKAVPYVNLDNNYYYPDSYLGNYWIEPSFDISKPYPVILKKDKV